MWLEYLLLYVIGMTLILRVGLENVRILAPRLAVTLLNYHPLRTVLEIHSYRSNIMLIRNQKTSYRILNQNIDILSLFFIKKIKSIRGLAQS